jgi:hypothetical protein
LSGFCCGEGTAASHLVRVRARVMARARARVRLRRSG